MQARARRFVFRSVGFAPERKEIVFHYAVEFAHRAPLHFTERILLPRAPRLAGVPKPLLRALLRDLHRVLGLSYYKLFFPPSFGGSKPLARAPADFWNTVYRKGLGEFLYRNRLDPRWCARFPSAESSTELLAAPLPRRDRCLVGIGGGKESIVAGEMLKEYRANVTAFVVETQRSSPIINDVVRTMGIPALRIRRVLDEQLFQELEGSYQGHVPVSAIYAFLGLLAAVLYDYRYVIVGNEWSSSVGNVRWKNDLVNHQWSKSAEFEERFQAYTRRFLTPDITYFSLLRPLTELRIAELFATYPRYFPFFSSCNRQFTARGIRPESRWCGKCPKCAFVFLLLSATLPRQTVEQIFRRDLFAEPKLFNLFRDLLGFGSAKPFDCVGTFEEARAALWLTRARVARTAVGRAFLPKIVKPQALLRDVRRARDAPTMPPHFRFLGLKSVLLLGYGVEGRATHAYLRRRHRRLRVGITETRGEVRSRAYQARFDLAVKSPGIPRRFVSIPYTTATNLFFSHLRGTGALTIGITGSKGKSTTASLIAAILRAGGRRVRLLGNIGKPMLEALRTPLRRGDVFVLELSSHQLDDLRFSPRIAAALNLFPEHLPYHGGMEAYASAKQNIVTFQGPDDTFIYNPRDRRLRAWARKAVSRAVPWRERLPLPVRELPLLGAHNVENVRAAVTTARRLGVSDAAMRRALRAFRPLPHRLERVGTYRGITFYDDAISTAPESTIAALRSLPQVGTIFLGGEDRGVDFAPLERELRKRGVRNLVLFPESGRRILKSRRGFTILETSSMATAVRFAYRETPKGAVCLLSTASPSYSLWKNFEEKGRQFQRFVRRHGK